MKNKNWIKGHEWKGKAKINIKKQLHKIGIPPLGPLISYLRRDQSLTLMFQNEYTKHFQAYGFYYLSIERFLKSMSITRRWNNSCHWARRNAEKYTDQLKKIASQYNKVRPYLELDFFNCLIHARILLDRSISIRRYFINEKKLPSFTSYNHHKKFFTRMRKRYGKHEEYAKYVREKTAWFDVPLKLIRDKYLVHSGPKHLQIFGWPNTYELDLTILPIKNDEDSKREVIVISIIQLIEDIDVFLNWLCNYGLKSSKNRQQKP